MSGALREEASVDWKTASPQAVRAAVMVQERLFFQAVRAAHFPSQQMPKRHLVVRRPDPVPKTLVPSDDLFGGWRRIATECAAEAGSTVEEMKGHRRDKSVVKARQKAWWRMAKELGMSLPAIGRRMNRDHTTILWGIRQHEERLAADHRESLS